MMIEYVFVVGQSVILQTPGPYEIKEGAKGVITSERSPKNIVGVRFGGEVRIYRMFSWRLTPDEGGPW